MGRIKPATVAQRYWEVRTGLPFHGVRGTTGSGGEGKSQLEESTKTLMREGELGDELGRTPGEKGG